MKRKAIKNISLRRKISTLYNRIMLLFQILILSFIGLLIFTEYLDFIKPPTINEFCIFTANIGFKLENVLIKGQKNTKLDAILNTLNADTGTPIFAINLINVKNALEKNPWIRSAIVQRKLPDSIHITLSERDPIAIWQINKKLYLIDDEGFKITSENIENFPDLLLVVGEDANTYASGLIGDLSKHKKIKEKVLSAVRYGERRWNLNLQQNITVKMPETDFKKALNYLAELNKENKLFDQNYKVIDLRSSDKYYIEKNQ